MKLGTHQRKLEELCVVCGATPGEWCWNQSAAKVGERKHTATRHYFTAARAEALASPSYTVWDAKKEAHEAVLQANRTKRREAKKVSSNAPWVTILIQMGGDIGRIEAIAEATQHEQLMDIAARLLSGVHALVKEFK